MTEHEMIEALGSAIAALQPPPADIATTRRYYGKGEWLLAFDCLQWHLAHDRIPLAFVQPEYSMLLRYFADFLDERHHEKHEEILRMNRRKSA